MIAIPRKADSQDHEINALHARATVAGENEDLEAIIALADTDKDIRTLFESPSDVRSNRKPRQQKMQLDELFSDATTEYLKSLDDKQKNGS